MEYKTPSPTSVMSTVSFPIRIPIRKDDDYDDGDVLVLSTQYDQRRYYHATARHEMVLYGAIILVSTLGYVGYKKYHGEPLKPKSASEAQEAYRTLEDELAKRNLEHSRNKKEKEKRK
jgi:hypothetical protein